MTSESKSLLVFFLLQINISNCLQMMIMVMICTDKIVLLLTRTKLWNRKCNYPWTDVLSTTFGTCQFEGINDPRFTLGHFDESNCLYFCLSWVLMCFFIPFSTMSDILHIWIFSCFVNHLIIHVCNLMSCNLRVFIYFSLCSSFSSLKYFTIITLYTDVVSTWFVRTPTLNTS